jgi:hypothetical protein
MDDDDRSAAQAQATTAAPPLGTGMIEPLTPGFVKEGELPKRITGVQFCMMAPNDVRRISEYELVSKTSAHACIHTTSSPH